MKKACIVITLLTISIFSFAQSLDKFYNKTFELYTPFSGMSSNSKTGDLLGYKQRLNFWGVLNLSNTLSKSKPWGFSLYVGERQMGDMMFLLKGILGKNTNAKDFKNLYYLSDFGLLPNFRLGLNVIGKENTVVNVGLSHSYFITQTHFIIDGHHESKDIDWLCAGPNIYVDRAFTNWLALRVSTGPLFQYANGKHETENIPKIWEHYFEVFTSFGLFVGLDLLNFSKFHDDLQSNIKINRYDLKIGFRIHL